MALGRDEQVVHRPNVERKFHTDGHERADTRLDLVNSCSRVDLADGSASADVGSPSSTSRAQRPLARSQTQTLSC